MQMDRTSNNVLVVWTPYKEHLITLQKHRNVATHTHKLKKQECINRMFELKMKNMYP
jgi:hypothetical protein